MKSNSLHIFGELVKTVVNCGAEAVDVIDEPAMIAPENGVKVTVPEVAGGAGVDEVDKI